MESVENLVADHSGERVELISPTALLMIHGEKDLYTREPSVTESADAAIEWFDRYLHNSKGAAPTFTDIEKNKRIRRDVAGIPQLQQRGRGRGARSRRLQARIRDVRLRLPRLP